MRGLNTICIGPGPVGRAVGHYIVLQYSWRCHLIYIKVPRLAIQMHPHPFNRLFNRTECLGSKGRHGWTKWTRFDSGGSVGGIYGTDQNFMVPTNLVHIVVGPGRGMWDRKSKKHNRTMKQNQQPIKAWDETHASSKMQRPK